MAEAKAPRVEALLKELEKEKKKLEEELAPYRKFYEEHMNLGKFIEARNKIRDISKKLMPINNEIAAIVRSSRTNKGSLKVEGGEYK